MFTKIIVGMWKQEHYRLPGDNFVEWYGQGRGSLV